MKSLIAIILILIPLCVIPVMASTVTITGFISDDMCGKRHMMPGKSEAECVRECVRAGAKFALLADGKVYALDGMKTEVNALAGQKVIVTGELKENTLAVHSVHAAK